MIHIINTGPKPISPLDEVFVTWPLKVRKANDVVVPRVLAGHADGTFLWGVVSRTPMDIKTIFQRVRQQVQETAAPLWSLDAAQNRQQCADLGMQVLDRIREFAATELTPETAYLLDASNWRWLAHPLIRYAAAVLYWRFPNVICDPNNAVITALRVPFDGQNDDLRTRIATESAALSVINSATRLSLWGTDAADLVFGLPLPAGAPAGALPPPNPDTMPHLTEVGAECAIEFREMLRNQFIGVAQEAADVSAAFTVLTGHGSSY